MELEKTTAGYIEGHPVLIKGDTIAISGILVANKDHMRVAQDEPGAQFYYYLKTFVGVIK